MAVIVFHPQRLGQERLEEEGAKLRDFFLFGAGARCNLSSLYFQPWYDAVFRLLCNGSPLARIDLERKYKVLLSS
jgi:hypothetical protein